LDDPSTRASIPALVTSSSAEKARALRLERLKSMVEARLENPQAALEALLSEIRTGEPQTELWEALHGAALRDGQETALASAYQKITQDRRLQQFEASAQVEILMHAADFFQGVMGDGAAAEGFLERVLLLAPDHAEAFARLERRVLAANDQRRLIEFYALVISGQPKSAGELATKAINLIVPLPAVILLSEVACKRMVKLAGTHPSILEALDVHCRKTKRFELACALIEQALLDPALPKTTAVDQRRRLIELYTGEANAPANAIAHVEELLNGDPADSIARAGAERLLSVREVAPRAAAALQNARRQARSG
jgi:hypothetical protein